jgi:hypothetical protein
VSSIVIEFSSKKVDILSKYLLELVISPAKINPLTQSVRPMPACLSFLSSYCEVFQ